MTLYTIALTPETLRLRGLCHLSALGFDFDFGFSRRLCVSAVNILFGSGYFFRPYAQVIWPGKKLLASSRWNGSTRTV